MKKIITKIETINPDQASAPVEKPSIKTSGALPDALAKLGIEYRDEIQCKPVFVVQSKSVISLDSHFKQKKLCDGATFTTGHACVFSCEFCYVKTVLRKNKKVAAILKETGLQFEDIVIEIATPATVARKFLNGKSKPKFNDPNDQRVIYASPLVDIAATMDHVKQTVEVCLAILESTHWHIRLLSKSNLLKQVAKGIPDDYKLRMIYGFSTGTLDDGLAKIFERGTALPSKRIEALHWLQDNGYRTFGMPCPTLPQKDYEQFAVEVASTIRVDKCEHVWVEVLNPRGDSLPGTARALRTAGRDWEADQLETLAHSKELREDYARKTFEAFAKVVPPEKLRFMQYVSKDSYDWWKSRENQGAIVLGAHANKLAAPKQEPADPLTDDEKKAWGECQKGVRHNFKACLTAYVQLGKLLVRIRDQRLYREQFKSFEVYCRRELEIARSTAYGYISDYDVATKLSEISDISKLTKEIHLRPIVSLPKEEREQAIEILRAKAGGGGFTPLMLQEAAAEVIALRPLDIPKPVPPEPNPEKANEPVTPGPAGNPSVPPAGQTADTVTPAAGNSAAANRPATSQDGALLKGFLQTIKQIVTKAAEVCPGYKLLLAKNLRDLAAGLEKTAQANEPTAGEDANSPGSGLQEEAPVQS